MTVCYLEVDDEITGAIARLRSVKDGEAVIVVPHGSRIATSRINFKLLAREGNERHLNVVAVSDEPGVRAMSTSAGLPAYDSIPAAEQALANFREQDRRLAERLGREPTDTEKSAATAAAAAGTATGAAAGAVGAAPGSLERTQVMRAATTRESAEVPTTGSASERRKKSRRRIGLAPILSAVFLILIVAFVAYGAYLFLPTATVTIHPQTSLLAPAPITVVADPDVAVSDVAAGVVPAQRIEIPLSASSDFRATGTEIIETKATGSVRFRSENTLNPVPVAEGTVVSTIDGIDFETTEAANVPAADFSTSTPGTVDVAIRAVRNGVRGNVAANTITELPAGLANQLVSVRNPDAVSGGSRTQQTVVQQSDYDAAVDNLDQQLEFLLDTQLHNPATTPAGLTLFPITAQTGTAVTTPTAEELVGTAVDRFSLSMNSTATVTAVNEALVDDLAQDRLRDSLTGGLSIVGDKVNTTRSEPTIDIEKVSYEVAPSATVFTSPDGAALAAAVRGKSIAEARSILAPYGMVDISMWPAFIDRLPDQSARISLVVVPPSPPSPAP